MLIRAPKGLNFGDELRDGRRPLPVQRPALQEPSVHAIGQDQEGLDPLASFRSGTGRSPHRFDQRRLQEGLQRVQLPGELIDLIGIPPRR